MWLTMKPARPVRKTRRELEQMSAEISAAAGRKINWRYLREFLRREHKRAKFYRNDRYQAQVETQTIEGVEMAYISIKSVDKSPIHDWRHFQQIKNDILGPECEAVELYPAESRLMDCANQYHLYGFTDPKMRFPFGYKKRTVSDMDGTTFRQRPTEER